MNQGGLDRKALGRARLEARKLRISRIRRKVAMLSASLTLLFSGLVVGLHGMPLLLGSGEEAPAPVTQTDGPGQQIGATVVALATNLIFDGDEEGEDGGGFFSTSTDANLGSSQS